MKTTITKTQVEEFNTIKREIIDILDNTDYCQEAYDAICGTTSENMYFLFNEGLDDEEEVQDIFEGTMQECQVALSYLKDEDDIDYDALWFGFKKIQFDGSEDEVIEDDGSFYLVTDNGFEEIDKPKRGAYVTQIEDGAYINGNYIYKDGDDGIQYFMNSYGSWEEIDTEEYC